MAVADKPIGPFVEAGNRQLGRGRSWDHVEFLPALRGRQRAEIYREMMANDALIGAIMFAITMILRRVEWTVTPSSPSNRDLARADFLASCKDDMSISWAEFVEQALTMLGHGHAVQEIVYKQRASSAIDAPSEKRTKYPDGRIGWRKFAPIPQETITDWTRDDHGGVQAVTQGGYGIARVTIPIEKLLLFRTSKTTPQGTSILRSVVESWYYRKRIRELEAIGVERDLAGLPVVYVSQEIMSDSDTLDEYRHIIRNLRRNEQEGVVLPAIMRDTGPLEPLARLELVGTGARRQFDTDAIISRYGREIAMAVLQDMVLLGHEKIGTQALASEKRDLSDTALQCWLDTIANVINDHAIPRLFALNGEDLADLPCLEPGELRPTDVTEFATAIRDIAGGGFFYSDDPDVDAEVRRRLGLPPALPEGRASREEPDDAPDDDPEDDPAA